MNTEDIIKAVGIFSMNIPNGEDIIKEALIKQFGIEGKKLFYFMPIAFGWEIFSRLGATEFSKTIRTNNVDTPKIYVEKNSLFISLIKFADSEMSNYFENVPKNSFEDVLYYGAEGEMAKQIFSEGKNLIGAKIEEPYIRDVFE